MDRADNFRAAAAALGAAPLRIVETGTLRDPQPRARQGDGWSTLAWAEECARRGGRLFTVDANPEALAACREVTAAYAASIVYVESDSVVFLRLWSQALAVPGARLCLDGAVVEPRPIDLLYLDGLDWLPGQEAASEAHHLAEIEAAFPALAERCAVLHPSTNNSIAIGKMTAVRSLDRGEPWGTAALAEGAPRRPDWRRASGSPGVSSSAPRTRRT